MDKPFAITLDVGSSLANKTGSWRTERAVYVDRLPPCNHACPAGENIQQWLYEAESGGETIDPASDRRSRDNRAREDEDAEIQRKPIELVESLLRASRPEERRQDPECQRSHQRADGQRGA